MRRFHKPADLVHTYQLYPPSGSNSWRILRIEPGRPRKTIANDKTRSIVAQYKAGSLTKDEAKEQLQLVIEALYKADGVKVSRVESNSENEKLVAKYVAQVIAKKRMSKQSKEAAENYIRAGVRALGEHSMLSADAETLQAALDEKYPDRRQRRVVASLNSILTFVGRDVKLVPHAFVPPDVKHIPLAKLKPILDRLPEHWAVAAQMAAYTGLRIGELMALEMQHKKRWGVFVEWQIKRDGTKALPKNGKRRNVAVFDEALSLYSKWLNLKRLITPEEREQAAEILKSACRRAYPNRPEWHLRFHDLRHSFAVACLERGMGLDWVAMQLGNGLDVCQKHYVGFVQTSAMEQAAHALLNGNGKDAA